MFVNETKPFNNLYFSGNITLKKDRYYDGIPFNRRYRLPYVKGKFTSDQCIVCLDEFVEDMFVCELVCKHAFHYQCCREWFINKTSCPICRRKMGVCVAVQYRYKKKKNADGEEIVSIFIETSPYIL
ncbi:hypothetical protein HELRODRAFT_81493 [Helobdella robusta]|uniref:RING-type domain-containing protein n=1 Tax=Helobdella robusta TaxID=6412 RepID=T1G4F1_HELRO|nr:hypothetical protein HELRODRAFT_81493 [Helobdella robusta]ESO01506.1 hypothetical protein HELRODRAFT_81493 [Helobdella robusta]